MPFVSAHYAPPPPTELPPMPPDAPKQVWAYDEEGRQWSLTEDSQLGDWLRYIEGGGTIDPAPEVEEPQQPQQPLIPERDYGAEIDALDARVTALESK